MTWGVKQRAVALWAIGAGLVIPTWVKCRSGLDWLVRICAHLSRLLFQLWAAPAEEGRPQLMRWVCEV